MPNLEIILGAITPMILKFVSDYPIIATILFFIGFSRSIMKPLMTAFESITVITETKKDDEFLAKLKENKIYQMVVFLMDWVVSIKLPKKEK